MKSMKLWHSLSALFALAVIAAPLNGAVIVDDVFADGSAAATGPLQADFFGSSSASAVESNAGSLGLVSGTSGRQAHAIFPTQTLATAGDYVQSTVFFTTPGFIASNATAADLTAASDAAAAAGDTGTFTVGVPASSDDLKIGIFDHLGRGLPGGALLQDTSYSTNSPNANYNGIAGYHIELDVDPASTTNQDIDIRRSDSTNTSGRLLSTNTGTPSIGSGPDIGYVFAPNNQYSLFQEILLDAAGGVVVTSTFTDVTSGTVIGTHSETDATPASLSFGLLAFGASSEAFGLSNDGGIPDNGIDITRFLLESEIAVIPEPSSLALLGLMGCAGLIRRRR